MMCKDCKFAREAHREGMVKCLPRSVKIHGEARDSFVMVPEEASCRMYRRRRKSEVY